MPHTAARLRPFATSIFATMSRLAVERGAVNLGQGFPDFDGPSWIKDAAKAAIDQHSNQYAPLPGLPVLRQRLAARYTRDTGLPCDADTQVCITCGCTEAIAAALLGLCNPGDEVAIVEPFFDSYRGCLALASATPVPIALRPVVHNGRIIDMALDEGELRAAMARKPRAILFNTPHNPTGKVFTPAELALIARLCVEHDVIAISDEVYERLVFGGARHISIASLPGMADRTMTLSSIGKTFSLTGWKVGWVIGSPSLVTAARAAHQQLTFSIATPLQHAAAEALRREDDAVAELLPLLAENRDRLAEGLRRLDVELFMPDGTYFIYARHEALSRRLGVTPAPGQSPDVACCMALIDRGIAAIPPTAFYVRPELGASMIRLAFCKRRETIDQGLAKLAQL